MSLVIRDNIKINSVPGSGTGEPILTRAAATGVVGKIGAIDTSTFVSTTLTSGRVIVGNSSNVATGVAMSGVIAISNTGVTSHVAGSIVNADVNASAGIALTKLAATTTSRLLVSDGSGFITPSSVTATEVGYLSGITSSVQTQLGTKVTNSFTTNRALTSNGSGNVAVSAVTATELGYVSGVTSAIQTQLSAKHPAIQIKDEGSDVGALGSTTVIDFVGAGVSAADVAGTVTVTIAGAANGQPSGGSAAQFLTKIDGTDYNSQWSTLTTSLITDVTASASDINLLTGLNSFGITTTELEFINGVTSNVQAQLDAKRGSTLTANYIWVGNGSNESTPLAPGSNGTVLTISGGAPVWSAPSTNGHVIQEDTTPLTDRPNLNFGAGLTASDNAGTTSTDVVLDTSFGILTTRGDILVRNASNVTARLAVGSSGYILTSDGTDVSWAAPSVAGHVIEAAGTPLTQRANLNFTGGLTASDNSPDTDVVLGGIVTNNISLVTTQVGYAWDFEIGGNDGSGNSASLTLGIGDFINSFTLGANLISTGGGSQVSMQHTLAASAGALQFVFNDASGAVFSDTRGTKNGIQYAASGYVTSDRSLTDREYVLGAKTFTGSQTLRAGTATTGTAPLYLQSGTALTTPANGALEYHSSHLYFTIGSTRYQLDQQGGIGGSTGSTDNAILRADGTGGSTMQASSVFIDDTANLTLGTASIAGNRYITVSSSTSAADLILDPQGTTGQVIVGSRYFQLGETTDSDFTRTFTCEGTETNIVLDIYSKGPTSWVDLNGHFQVYEINNLERAQIQPNTYSGLQFIEGDPFFTLKAVATVGNSADLRLLSSGEGANPSGHVFIDTASGGSETVLGNIGLFTTSIADWQDMEKGMAIANATTAPTGGIADSVAMWSADVSSSSELFVMNEAGIKTQLSGHTEVIQIALSDLITALTTGTSKAYFRMPYAFTLTGVRASVLTAPTDATIIVDINESGSTILSTRLTIDSGEKTSTTAAVAAVISDASLADDAEITFDIDQVGSTVAGAGLIVTLIGYKTI